MNLNLPLLIPLPISLLDNLLKLLPVHLPILTLQDRNPAQRINPIPKAVECQPHLKAHPVGTNRVRKQGLLRLGLPRKDLVPDVVAESRLVVCGKGKVQLT